MLTDAKNYLKAQRVGPWDNLNLLRDKFNYLSNF